MTQAVIEQIPDLNQKILEVYEKERRIFPCRSNRASELGHPCLRYLTYMRKDWDRRKSPSAEKLLLFEAGEYIEKLVIKRLDRAGFNVVQQQRDFEDQKTQITCHIDGMVEITNGKPELYPIEVKGLNQFDWAKINTAQDLLNSNKYWLQKYPAQLQIYLFMAAKPTGLFCLVNKTSMAMKFLWMDIDMDFCEELLNKATEINSYLDSEDYPPRIEYDEKICAQCDFNHICLENVPVGHITVINDEELEGLLERYTSLQPTAKEFDQANEELKEVVKNMPEDIVVVGNYELRRKTSVRKFPPQPERETTVITKHIRKLG
jgi:CRISPR/Cas system-associated exonuclease Cas4 (RecB family)